MNAFEAAAASFVAGFPVYVLHVAAAGVMLAAASVIYVILTPYKEMDLIRDGNATAGLSFAGVIIGLAIPLAAAVASSFSVFELAIWGLVALLLQLFAFRVTDILLRDLTARIERDEAGAAIVLIAIKIATGLILAAGMMDPGPVLA